MKHPYCEVIESSTEQIDNYKMYTSLSKEGWVEEDNSKPVITNYSVTFSISSDSIEKLRSLIDLSEIQDYIKKQLLCV